MLQMFQRHIASVKMFHQFSDACFASGFDWDVTYVSHLLQEYVPMVSAISVFMLQ
jgi:hypothetical protein